MRNVPVQILNVSDDTSHTGDAFPVEGYISASFVPITADTSAAGTVKLQGSNDLPVGSISQFTPTGFADIPNATSSIASGVGPAIILTTMNFQYIRAIYTSASGGSTTIVVNMSALSANG